MRVNASSWSSVPWSNALPQIWSGAASLENCFICINKIGHPLLQDRLETVEEPGNADNRNASIGFENKKILVPGDQRIAGACDRAFEHYMVFLVPACFFYLFTG